MGTLRGTFFITCIILSTVFVSLPVWSVAAPAVDTINVEHLPKDPKDFRKHVDQIIGKVDGLVQKLKGNKNAESIVMDLLQTRDNVLREIPKVEGTPDGAKWLVKDMRESVEAMLKLLKVQYEKAAGMAE